MLVSKLKRYNELKRSLREGGTDWRREFGRTLFLLVLMVVVPWEGFAIPQRVELIPHGERFRCLTCHVVAGGVRNPFGEAVGQIVDEGSTDPFWSVGLARADADGDGLTNGEELQDPEGKWQVGQESPGDRALVTNPGVPDQGHTPKLSWRHRLARFAEPLGICTFCLLVLTALLGYFMPKNRKLLFRWHKRFAVVTLLSALAHATCVILRF